MSEIKATENFYDYGIYQTTLLHSKVTFLSQAVAIHTILEIFIPHTVGSLDNQQKTI